MYFKKIQTILFKPLNQICPKSLLNIESHSKVGINRIKIQATSSSLLSALQKYSYNFFASNPIKSTHPLTLFLT